MRVLFATPEMDDFVRVGGLAAVSAALPRAIRPIADVRVVIPGYREVLTNARNLAIVGRCPAHADMPACDIGRTETADGLPVYVVIAPALYERDGTPYVDLKGTDWKDNDVRFGRFSLAVADLADGKIDPAWRADLVHANDWQSGLVPAYLAWRGSRVPTVLTIHNLAYQGIFPREVLRRIGAPGSAFQIDGLEFYGKVSFLKGGLYYAAHLTTVSETYAREITSPEFGCGLEGLLAKRARANELTGILNGIADTWDPRACPELAAPFAAGEWTGKRANAEHVRREFGLAASRGPLFGLVARLVHQKGVDLALSAVETIVNAGGQIVVMGRGESRFERALQAAQQRRPDSVAAAIRFEDGSARRIFAGSDFTLVPSRFEPCGLSQMYAQRFGSLPIGRRTGGLSETISDGETGYLFSDASAESLLGGICRAFATFGRKTQLNTMRKAAMAKSYSWTESAPAYVSLYRRAGVA